MTVLERISEFLNRVLAWMAGGFLAGIVLLTCANILLRIVWKPVMGTVELVGYSGAIVTGFALGYTHIKPLGAKVLKENQENPGCFEQRHLYHLLFHGRLADRPVCNDPMEDRRGDRDAPDHLLSFHLRCGFGIYSPRPRLFDQIFEERFGKRGN